jgi:hypothetical protein
MSVDQVRTVADAVLYEGYLLYPYRASAGKNQVRWQFGVLGPPGAAESGVGEESTMSVQCLLTSPGASDEGGRTSGPAGLASVRVHLRFLQVQARMVERYDVEGGFFVPVDQLDVGGRQWLSWDEAVEQELALDVSARDLRRGGVWEVGVSGHRSVETIPAGTATPSGNVGGEAAGRVVRRRWPIHASVSFASTPAEGCTRLEVRVVNTSTGHPPDQDSSPRDMAIRTSLIGAHLILEAEGARFLSVVDPPDRAAAAARGCTQHRCWPVLAGRVPEREEEQGTSAVVLASPIILYDFPQVAEQSTGALFDSTEIDELLTLRVMTMTDEEKAEARATDPKAREIIDRCDAMSPEALQQLHGVLRDVEPAAFGDPDVPWWDPAADESVDPDVDTVVVDGVPVSRGSLVRVHPSRRADAQDLFFTDQVARVQAVISDVDGGVHVAVVLADDPAADLHDWYGRYWYFAPDELEPLPDGDGPPAGTDAQQENPQHREESRP